jgi:hypothetical protein
VVASATVYNKVVKDKLYQFPGMNFDGVGKIIAG